MQHQLRVQAEGRSVKRPGRGRVWPVRWRRLSPAVAERPVEASAAQGALDSSAVEAAAHLEAVLTGCAAVQASAPPPLVGPCQGPARSPAQDA